MRPPFGNLTLWSTGERLHSQMWMHRFGIISLSIICLGAIICDLNTMGFVSACACSICDALVASCETFTR